jgi:Gpi18-like mannosyltransferase
VSKIPYLIFDFALALLLLHMIDDGKKASLAFKLWMLSPISILISFAVGQIDIMSAFFLVLALYFFKKRRELSSIVSLGICGIVKMFGMLFILPMALIYLKKRSGLKSKAKHLSLMLIVGFLPLAVDQISTLFTTTYYESANLAWPISNEVIGFFGKTFYSFGQQGNAILRGVFLRFLDFSASFATYSFDKIYFTVFIYGLFLLGVVYLKDWSFERVWKAFLVFLLAYYAFALFHPQWFLLAVPLLIFAVAEDRDRYFRLYLLLVALYFVYVCYWNGFFTSMLAPILHQAYFWPGQIELLNNLNLPGYQVINIFRSILSAVFVVFAALILRIDRLLHKSGA